MSDQGTITVATNRINIHEYFREKSKTFLGRISQWLFPENLTQIATNVRELKKLCELAEIDSEEYSNSSDHGDILIDYKAYKTLLNQAIINSRIKA